MKGGGHLVVVLFTELTAVFPCDAHRVLAPLQKARVLNDPVATLLDPQPRHDPIPHARQHRRVGPRGVRHKVVQRLMLGARMQRIGAQP